MCQKLGKRKRRMLRRTPEAIDVAPSTLLELLDAVAPRAGAENETPAPAGQG